MRIFFTHDIFSQQRYGGVGKYISELMSDLLADGHDVSSGVFASRFRGTETSMKSLSPLLARFANMQGGSVPLMVLNTANEYVQLLNTRKGRGPEIVHWSNYSSRPLPKHVPQVVTVHDMIHEDFPQFFKSPLVSIAKRRLVERADAIIAVSGYTKLRLLHYFPEVESKVTVIYHGLEWHPQSAATKTFHWPKPFVLYVGSRGRHKNFELAAKIFARSQLAESGVDFILFGGGELSPQEQNLIRSLGISVSVSQMSGGNDVLRGAYRQALALIISSLCEGFGYPVLEAMQAGCPVISSNGGSLLEVVGDAGFLFDPRSPDGAVAQLRDIASTPSLRSELSKRSVERAKLFSRATAYAKTLSVYRSLL